MRGARSLAASPVFLATFAPSPVVDEELLWFFHVEDGDPASSTYVGRMFSPVTEDGRWRSHEDHRRAVRRHGVVLARIKAIPDHDAGVLQCAYAPRPWPIALAKAYGQLTGVAVRLACDRATWPEERGRQLAIDDANAKMLLERLGAGGEANRRALAELRREAEVHFVRALRAYGAVRRGDVGGVQ
jgi:hypothetical protein